MARFISRISTHSIQHVCGAAMAACLALASVSAQAQLQTYSSLTAFTAATLSTDATGPLPNLGNTGGAITTVGTVAYQGVSSMWICAAGAGIGSDWSPLLAGNDVALEGQENFNIITMAPVYSFGIEIAEPSVGVYNARGCFVDVRTDSTFQVTLLNAGNVAVGSFTFNAANDQAAFIGVTSALPFLTVQIREIVGSNDNEYFGRVYTGNTAILTAIPEPAGWLLLAAGLAALAAVRRRRAP